MKRPTLHRSASRTIDRVPSTLTLSYVRSGGDSSMIPATCATTSHPSAHPRRSLWSVMLAGQDSTPSGHSVASAWTFRLNNRIEWPCLRSSETAACPTTPVPPRSEEHTSELQSQSNLVCRLLLEKKKTINNKILYTTTYSRRTCQELYRILIYTTYHQMS